MTNKIQRGLQADALLANEFFREILNGLDAAYIAAWRLAKTPEAREDAYRYVMLTEKLIADITSVSNTGQIEAARHKELQGKKGIIAWPTR